MTYPEFLEWREFYRLFPFDDVHRHYRPAALIASAQGMKVNDSMDWLQPKPELDGYSDAELRSFKAHGITPPPRRK